MRFFDKYKNAAKIGVLFALFLLMMGTMVAFATSEGETPTTYSLTIEKQVVDSNGGSVTGNTDVFSFTLTLEDHDSPCFHTLDESAKVQEFSLKAGEKKIIKLSCGYKYTITETPVDGYEVPGTISGQVTGEIEEIVTNKQKQGSYWVVHEYYKNEDLDTRIEMSSPQQEFDTLNSEHAVKEIAPQNTAPSGKVYVYKDSVGGVKTGDDWQENGSTSVKATEEGNEIIILRYYLTGGYNVRHEYYTIPAESEFDVEDQDLDLSECTREDHGEITSQKKNLRLDNTITHKAKDEREERGYDGRWYTPRPDLYEHETETGEIGPDGYVVATEDYSDTIVLRYVRKEPGPDEGYYKIRHEYYLVDNDGKVIQNEGTEDGGQSEPRLYPNGNQYTFAQVTPIPNHTSTFDNVEYPYEFQAEKSYHEKADGSTGAYVEDTPNGDETIVMVYYRYLDKGFYRIVHEYYENEVAPANLVGRSEIKDSKTVDLPSSETFTANSGMWELQYKGRAYDHVSDAYGKMSGNNDYNADSSMSYVVATATGEQVIILQYVLSAEPPKGDLTVTKTVNGEGADPAAAFTFTVTLTGEGAEDVNGSYGGMTFYNGVATFTLRDGQSLTASGLPIGLDYTVTEEPAEGYARENKGGLSGAITEGGLTAAFTNTFKPEPPLEDIPDGMVPLWNAETEEWIYVPEDDVPLADADAPRTGDESRIAVWGTLALVSLGGLMVLAQVKRRENGK